MKPSEIRLQADASADHSTEKFNVPSEWSPIETAPKDGTTIILYGPTRGVSPGKFDDNKYAKKPRPYWEDIRAYLGVLWMREREPTHWMPLPAPPQAASRAREREEA